MQDLDEIASIFDRCVILDRTRRETILGSITDPRLAARLRSLLRADAAAEREGFLTRLPH